MRGVPFGLFRFAVEAQADVQDAFAAPAQQCQCTVRRDGDDSLGIIEVIGEFFTLFLLSFHNFRFHYAMIEHVFAQRLQQSGVLGKALHQDLARAVQRGLGVGHARIVALGGGERCAQELAGFGFRMQLRMLQQAVGQRG